VALQGGVPWSAIVGYKYSNPKIDAEKWETQKYASNIIELTSLKHFSASFWGWL
jgi:hypothetical protein